MTPERRRERLGRVRAALAEQDLDGFLKLLRTIHERWPDVERLPWYTQCPHGGRHIVAAQVVNRCLDRLCYDTDRQHDHAFRQWTERTIRWLTSNWRRSMVS